MPATLGARCFAARRRSITSDERFAHSGGGTDVRLRGAAYLTAGGKASPAGRSIALDIVQTVAFAGVILFAGYGIRRLVPILGKVNIPAPVCGGLPVLDAG